MLFSIDDNTKHMMSSSFAQKRVVDFVRDCAEFMGTQEVDIPENVELYIHGTMCSDESAALVGAASVLQFLHHREKINIRMIHGYGLGAFIGVVCLCDLPLDSILQLYRKIQRKPTDAELRDALHEMLPSDAYARCSDRLTMDITTKLERVSQFNTNEHLVQILVLASHSYTVLQTVRKMAGHLIWQWSQPMDNCTGVELCPPTQHTIPTEPGRLFSQVMKGAMDVLDFAHADVVPTSTIRLLPEPLCNSVRGFLATCSEFMRTHLPICEIRWQRVGE